MVRLYDTLAREVVEVSPAGDRLTMYTCGPTVYRSAHIGNLRTFLMADLIRRTFEYTGTTVEQVQNITDVGHMTDELFDRGEDKMLVAARLEDKTPAEIAAHYTDRFLEDVAAFNIRPASSYPRASDHIPQMLRLIATLIERGHAYEIEGNVYFDVTSFPNYGRLSGNTPDRLRAGHRDVVMDERRRSPADFVLWVAAGASRVVTFDSPWGLGYPGWHIECSAMSMEQLGETFDLHTGGEDNVFPHHEDEIAQSEGAVGHQVVRHWVHGAHVLSEGRKMAKSAENFYDLRDLAERGHRDPLAARLLFLQSRYRAQMNLTLEALSAAERTLERWRRLIADWAGDQNRAGDDGAFERRFVSAITEDLDTPSAIALVAEVVSTDGLAPGDKAALLSRWDQVLGLDLGRDVGVQTPVPEQVRDLIAQRERARGKKDWSTADRLRHKILALGFEVEDTAGGPRARPRST